MKIKRCFSMPNKNTFLMSPVQDLINTYFDENKKWIDSFCNDSIFKEKCYLTNDFNNKYKCDYNLDAYEFLKLIETNSIDGVLFDPPYSPRQIKECYNSVGKNPTSLETSANFYSRCYQEIDRILKVNGYIISFGWNSNGINNYKKVEILLVNHGGQHNDTICLVEQKKQTDLFNFF